jgi:hypothetical protein
MRMQRRIALIVGAVLAALSRMGFILTANGGTTFVLGPRRIGRFL